MPIDWQRLCDNYRNPGAKNVRRDEAIKRAIRTELVGGEDLLDALQLVNRVRVRLQDKSLPGVQEAKTAETALRELRELMEGEILSRYTADSQ